MMTPREVADMTFAKSMVGGYQMSAVDDFLDRLTEDYYQLYQENAALQTKVKLMTDKLAEYREVEDTMRSTLLTAQRMATEMVQEAESKRNAAFEDAGRALLLRQQELQAELAQEEQRLARAKAELRDYISAVRAVCQKQLTFLDLLPVEEPAAAEEPVCAAEEPVVQPEESPLSVQPPVGASPMDTVSMLEEIFSTVESCVAENAESGRRINLDDLSFHKECTNGK